MYRLLLELMSALPMYASKSILSTYWVQGIVLDGVDRVVSALLELTCQWGKSDNEQVNKYAIFCLAVKDNQDTQEAKSEKMKSLKSVWEDLSRDLYNVGKDAAQNLEGRSRHRKQLVERPWGWNAVEGEVVSSLIQF